MSRHDDDPTDQPSKPKQYTIDLPKALHERLEREADALGMTVAELLQERINDAASDPALPFLISRRFRKRKKGE